MPELMTPEFSRALALLQFSPYWHIESDGGQRWRTFIDQVSEYATYDDLPGDLKAIFEAAQAQMTARKARR